MSPEILVEGLILFVVFVFSTTLHEAGHAFAALKLGDPTAYEGGQVTLNPMPHIRREPWGMVVVPILYFVLTKGSGIIGWASAPYDPHWAHRYPKRAAIMAAAGPAMNLLLVVLSGLVIRFALKDLDPNSGVTRIIFAMFLMNLLLFVFNLLPLPPLDGSAILPVFMSDDLADRYRSMIHQPIFSMVSFLVAWNLFPYIFDPIQRVVVGLLMVGM